MSKRGYLSRYLLIVKRLRSKSICSYEDLRDYIQRQLEFLQLSDDDLFIGFSLRTLQRDLKDIRNLYGIDIRYSKANKGYRIVDNEMDNINFQRMMEAFDTYNSLNLSQELKPYLQLENRRPQGTENIYGIL